MHRKLILGLLIGNVLLRFFTNAIGVLPRALNVWDVIMTAALIGLAFIVPPSNDEIGRGRIMRRMAAFSIVCILGSLLNTDYHYLPAALSQWVMWCEPILLFVALSYLPISVADFESFKRAMLSLVVLQIIIGICQAPFAIKAGQSEMIIGTFNGNAEQYQFFIAIGVFFLIAQREVGMRRPKLALIAVLAILILIVLIDNKASWAALGLTLGILLPSLPTLQGRMRGKLKAFALLAVFVGCGYMAVRFSSATAGAKFGGIVQAVKSGSILKLGKIKALRDVYTAYKMYPQMAIVGSGLGTFYSRAAFQYFPFRIYEMYDNEERLQKAPDSDVRGGKFDSKSMAGVISQAIGVDAFYRQFYSREKIFAVGSGTADFPTSSYISMLGEAGLLGALLYFSVHFWGLRLARAAVFRSAKFPELFPFAAATFAALVYLTLMGVYNYWIESGRINTIVWTMLAITLKVLSILEEEQTQTTIEDGEQEAEQRTANIWG